MIAVFDTNIVIDALKGVEAADVEYGRYDRVLISRITWMEVLIGAGEDDADLRDFMELYFEIVPLDLIVAESAVQIRRTKRIRLPDAVILATAQNKRRHIGNSQYERFSPRLGRDTSSLYSLTRQTLTSQSPISSLHPPQTPSNTPTTPVPSPTNLPPRTGAAPAPCPKSAAAASCHAPGKT